MSVSNAIQFPESAAEQIMSPAKPIDVERLSFDVKTVAVIVATAFLVGGANYVFGIPDRKMQTDMQASQAQMQSDIRDMRTRMESQSEVRKLEKELLDAQLAAMKATIENATNRAAALSMSQENSRLQNAQRGR